MMQNSSHLGAGAREKVPSGEPLISSAEDFPGPGVARSAACGVQSEVCSSLEESSLGLRESKTGFTCETQTGVSERAAQRYCRRLYRFYEHYNPSKLGRISEYLTAYKGREEQLMAILIGKYGPEPDDRRPQLSLTSNVSANEVGAANVERRYKIPAAVSPQEGNTDCETPYWRSSSPISERDILALLCNLETTNEELRKCYIGLLAQHPSSSWNGMTYITRAEIFTPGEETFLGHKWTSTLDNKKVLVYDGTAYDRMTFFCRGECQRATGHERWRLCVYTSAVSSLYLVRAMWDPVIHLDPVPFDRSAPSQPSSCEAIPLMGSSVSCMRSCGKSSTEPEQPLVSAMMMNIVTLLTGIDKKFTERFDALETRMIFLESKLLSLSATKQPEDDT
uniref:Uncharacterized protein n=1 Tax=Trypanosoma congolense (strain IL3000) TaxID=1068625 RepID=G0UYK5_TRYCI|nr:conserved hypothetical protein [Trypanosoma congolense IL3000]